MVKFSFIKSNYTILIPWIFILIGLYSVSLYSYLLFHSLAEIFSIVIGCGIFMLSWNSREFAKNNFLLFVGIAYLFVSSLDLVHTLSYKGMAIFQGYGVDLPTQLWIAARYLQSFSLLIAPLFFNRKLKTHYAVYGYSLIVIILLFSIFSWNIFPGCFVEGVGLTPFKKVSEYVISLILIGSIILLLQKRAEFDQSVFQCLVASIFFAILTELAFTFYVDVYGLSNLFGHFLKIISFYLIYKAIIETGLKNPYSLLFKKLKQSEDRATKHAEKYKSLIINLPVAVYSALPDETGTTIFMSERWKDWTGYSPEDFYKDQETWPKTIHSSDRDSAVKAYIEAYKQKREYLFEYRVVHKETGQVRHLLDHGVPIKDDRGEIIAVDGIVTDLTERKRAEEKLDQYRQHLEEMIEERTLDLKRSEEKFRQLAETITEIFWICDPDLTEMFYISPGYETVWGRTCDSLYKDPRSFMEAVHPDDRQRVEQGTAKWIQEGYNIEYRIIRPDGSVRWVWAHGYPVKDKSGKVYRIAGIAADITSKKQIEIELQKVARALRVLSSCNKRVNRFGKETDLLRDVCQIFVTEGDYRMAWIGYAEQDENKTIRPAAYAGFEDGYLDSITIAWADTESGRGPVGRAIRTGRPAIVKNVLSDPEFARWREEAVKQGYGSLISLPLVADTGTFAVLTIYDTETDAFDREEVELLEELADDTANGIIALRTRAERDHVNEKLKETKLLLETILDSIPDVIGLQDTDYGILRYNRAGYRLYNTSLEEVSGKKCYEIMGNDAVCEDCATAEVYKTKRPAMVERYEESIKRWIEHRSYPVLDPSGNIVYIVEHQRDITEQKRLEARFVQSQKMEAIGRLAGGVAHDFNNLLTSIIGYGELMSDELDKDHPLREHLEEILKAGNSAASLTRQLLAFSRKQVFQVKVIDLNELITDLNKMLVRLIDENVQLEMRLSSDPCQVEADPAQMEQVILNLAINARDAMPQGGKLTIETAHVDLDNDAFREHEVEIRKGPYVMIAVGDTGIGMDEETKSKIFEPFFTRKEVGKGTGLGLSTVYGVVKQSNGYIWVYSEPGEGTTFEIYLPFVKDQAEPKKGERANFKQLGGAESILLVEDNESLRNMALKVLKQYGYTVFAAQDGKEALNISEAYKDPIHLMVTDVVMPKISGAELAKRLQASRPEMKVLYMSGYTDSIIDQHRILSQETNFLPKPFSPESLGKKVREVLESD